MSGVLALVGGGEFSEACADLDADLLARSGGASVLVVAAAAAYEHPDRLLAAARARFEPLGATVVDLGVYGRAGAMDEAAAAAVRSAPFIYFTSGTPMHLRSVLKDTPVWSALRDALAAGAVIAASGGSAVALADPMVDARGGAFTLGLGLVAPLAVMPHHETWSSERSRRTLDLAPAGVPVAALDTGGAVVRSPDGHWTVAGSGAVVIHVDGRVAGVEALPR